MLTLIRNYRISVLEYPVTWRRNISKDSNMYVQLSITTRVVATVD